MVGMKRLMAEASSTAGAPPTTLRLAGIVDESVVDGPGVRLVVFAQGCPHRCRGCHNPHTWDFDGGATTSISEITLRAAANPILRGITLSGGEPFAQAPGFARLAQNARRAGLSVVTYTGYTLEQLLASPALDSAPGVRELLLATDILIDGPFAQALADPSLPYRGSRNQRIIHMACHNESDALGGAARHDATLPFTTRTSL